MRGNQIGDEREREKEREMHGGCVDGWRGAYGQEFFSIPCIAKNVIQIHYFLVIIH